MSGKETGENPIDVLERDHVQQAELCDMLEAIADDLPDVIHPQRCAQATAILRHDIPLHHRDEEEELFPLLQQRVKPEDELQKHLDQFKFEHATDEGVAQEISEELRRLSQGERPRDANVLGYMLRGFFENYRRHLHWENSFLLPLARKYLQPEDLKVLSRAMQRRRRA